METGKVLPMPGLEQRAKETPNAEMPILNWGPCNMCWWGRTQDTLRCFVDPPDTIYHAFPHPDVVNPKKMGVNFAFQGVRPSTEPDDTCSKFLDKRLPLKEVELLLKASGREEVARVLHSSGAKSPFPPPPKGGQ